MTTTLTVEDLEDHIPAARHPQRGERVERDLAGIEPDLKDTLSATALQSWASCELKGRFMIRGGAEKLANSSYAQDLQEDGKEFEDALINNASVWQALFKTEFGVVPTLRRLENKGPQSASEFEENLLVLKAASGAAEPMLFYQVGIFKETECGNETLTEQGAIDLIFWDGKELQLGEIKLTDNPKETTAYQLLYYKDFLEKAGMKIADGAFVMHCNLGWRYDRKRTQERKLRYVKNTRLTKFNLRHNQAAYNEMMGRISDFRLSAEEADPETHASLKPWCPECKFRSECYEVFRNQSEDPKLDKAGIEESSIELLKEVGITTVSQALDRIDSLEELHGKHPERKLDLKRRLEFTKLLGGYSTWIPPLRADRTPVPPEAVFFYASDLWWTLAEKEPTYKKVPSGVAEAIVVFTDKEYEPARIAHRLGGERGKEGPAWVILEKDIDLGVTFPFPNLSLKGLANALTAVAELGSWAAYQDGPIVKDHGLLLKKGLDEGSPGYRVDRASDVMRVYEALTKLHSIITADGRRI